MPELEALIPGTAEPYRTACPQCGQRCTVAPVIVDYDNAEITPGMREAPHSRVIAWMTSCSHHIPLTEHQLTFDPQGKIAEFTPVEHADDHSSPAGQAPPNPPMGAHGWVIPLPDGGKARCGGPAECQVCRQEWREVVYAARRESWGWRCGGPGICEQCRAALLATGIDLDAYAGEDPCAYDPSASRVAPIPRSTRCPSTGAPPRDWISIGHSESAHRLLGRCAHCPGHTAELEVVAWRSWAIQLLYTIDQGVCSGA
ncbi:hypothetical protein [Nonomuraea sp. NPDC052265]|uniref:hypothetical protein n=1 Tax=Nonomuraea sp. NPDC052265 TaxID=3364374 RepID=UPI0037CAA46F